MNKVKIFITYKEKHRLLKNEVVTPIQTGRAIANEIFKEMIGDDTGDNISEKNPRYCELSAQYWVWKHYKEIGDPDYIGFMHYRRLLNFNQNDNIQFFEQYDMSEKTVSQSCHAYDIVLPEKLPAYSPKLKKTAKNLKEQWEHEYDAKDLIFALEIIKKKNPKMAATINKVMKSEKAYWYNIFLMKKTVFQEYCDWFFDVLSSCEKYITKDRMLGFLGERLLNIFVEYKKSNGAIIKELPVFRPKPEQYNALENQDIPVVLISSNLYIPQTTTTMTSVLQNCTSKQNLKFYLLSDGITEKNKLKLVNYIEKMGGHCCITEITKEMKAPFENLALPEHCTVTTFIKLLIPEIFAQYDKILYLDSDVMVRKDISNLFNMDLGNNALGMVEDVANSYHAKRLWGKEASDYYNAGVLLFNAALWRQKRYFNLTLEMIPQNTLRYKFADQDMFNDVFRGKIQKIPPTWNQHHLSHGSFSLYRPSDWDEYNKSVADPAVIHYVGPQKVWYIWFKRPFKKEYFKYYAQTPFFKFFRKEKYSFKGIKCKAIILGKYPLFSKHKQYGYSLTRILCLKIYKRTGAETKRKEVRFCDIPLYILKQKQTIKKIRLLGVCIHKRKKSLEVMVKELQRNAQDLWCQITAQNAYIANLNCVIQAQTLHPKTFGPYKDAFKEKDVVLVCTGPTAKYYEPIKGAIHIGVNGAIYLPQVKLDYLFVQDNTVKQVGNEKLNLDINNYLPDTCRKFYGIIPPHKLKSTALKGIERIPLSYANGKLTHQYILEEVSLHNWAYDLSREPIGEFFGSPFSAMQFILYANPRRIYLVGCDCSSGYAYNDKNNFLPVMGQREIWLSYVLPYIETYFPDLEIISINPVGLKGFFHDEYTQTYLSKYPELGEFYKKG